MNGKTSYSDIFLENDLLLRNLQGGIVYADFEPPFYLRYATEGMAKLCGYSEKELLTMKQMDLVHDEDVETLAEEVGRQFAIGDTFEIEYQLRRKDGSSVYVLDRAKVVTHEDGKKYIHCLMTDITDLKQMEQDLRLSEEKYKMAIRQSGNVILEYQTSTKVITFSENYSEQFGEAAPTETLQEIIEGGVAPEQKGMVWEAFHQCLRGEVPEPLELQLLHGRGEYVWCTLTLAPLSHFNNHIYAVVGCLKNVDDQKHHLDHLTELSQRDGLTGIYNRITMEQIIDKHLKAKTGKAASALMIVDVDYFKQINDKYGHDCGDEVLIKLANTMGVLLPTDASLGRLGGDEFLIFIPNVQQIEDVEAYSKQLAEGVKAAFNEYRVLPTLSIGIAVVSEESTFKELYKKADQALYRRKEEGRDGYCVN